jgi:hypothetical protein
VQSAAIALPCAALAQPSDYRITEATQACERLDMVHTSVQNAKRGIGGFRLGCVSVGKGTEVRLIQNVKVISLKSIFAQSRVAYAAGSLRAFSAQTRFERHPQILSSKRRTVELICAMGTWARVPSQTTPKGRFKRSSESSRLCGRLRLDQRARQAPDRDVADDEACA